MSVCPLQIQPCPSDLEKPSVIRSRHAAWLWRRFLEGVPAFASPTRWAACIGTSSLRPCFLGAASRPSLPGVWRLRRCSNYGSVLRPTGGGFGSGLNRLEVCTRHGVGGLELRPYRVERVSDSSCSRKAGVELAGWQLSKRATRPTSGAKKSEES